MDTKQVVKYSPDIKKESVLTLQYNSEDREGSIELLGNLTQSKRKGGLAMIIALVFLMLLIFTFFAFKRFLF